MEKNTNVALEETAVVPEEAAPEEEYVNLFVYNDHSDNNPNAVVGINGKMYVMPKGEVSRVPASVAAEYERAQRAQHKADMNISAMRGIKQSN